MDRTAFLSTVHAFSVVQRLGKLEYFLRYLEQGREDATVTSSTLAVLVAFEMRFLECCWSVSQ